MKNFTGVIGDLMLFCILIFMLVLPFLVSLNLDPQVYEYEEDNVAGVYDVSDPDDINFTIEKIPGDSDRIFLIYTNEAINRFTAKYKLAPGGNGNDVYPLGKLSNNGDNLLKIKIFLYGDKRAMRSTNVSVDMGDQSGVLFDGDNFSPIEFDLSPNSMEEAQLYFEFRQPVHYENKIRVVVQVNKVN